MRAVILCFGIFPRFCLDRNDNGPDSEEEIEEEDEAEEGEEVGQSGE